MSQVEEYWDSQKKVSQLLSEAEFPEEGKKVLKAMNERINLLQRENRRLSIENAELQALNESLQKLMKTVEGRLDQWRSSYMRQTED